MIRNICPSILFSHVSISSFDAGVVVFRGGVPVIPCSPVSARGRFIGPEDGVLTGVAALDDREVSLAKGFSASIAGVAAGLMLIFGFEGSAAAGEDLGITWEAGVEAELPPSVVCSGLGLAGPASFSIRRRRICLHNLY